MGLILLIISFYFSVPCIESRWIGLNNVVNVIKSFLEET